MRQLVRRGLPLLARGSRTPRSCFASSMSSSRTDSVQSSKFTQAVFEAMRKLYPENLADKSFDNTGVLLEAPESRSLSLKPSVLLTIDLTCRVAQEAIEGQHSVVVAYHPIIFHGLKSLQLSNPQQQSLLRLAQAGISVYCPHTAVDAATGGNGDWLADLLMGRYTLRGGNSQASHQQPQSVPYSIRSAHNIHYDVHGWPRASELEWQEHPDGYSIEHSRKPIQSKGPDPETGIGRFVQLKSSHSLTSVLGNLLEGLGRPREISVAFPFAGTVDLDKAEIETIAICAGSGGSVVRGQKADLYVTGEMLHHEVMAFTESGSTVVCLKHSNSERGYLSMVMQGRLKEALKDSGHADAQVAVSQTDSDPFTNVLRVDG